MTSPFMRNRQRNLAGLAGAMVASAAAAAPQAPAEDSPAGQEYSALRVRLHDNLRQLADVESVEARQPLKAEFAKAFAPWVDGILAADEPVQDEILMTCLVWAIDYADFALAVTLGEFALKHGLAMPERYKRSAACFLREDIAEAALADPAAVDMALLIKIDQLTAGADMPDPAKAKLHKALGRAWTLKAASFDAAADSAPAGGAAAYVEQALEQLRRALALDKKAGVKKDIEQLERQLRDLGAPAAADGAGQQQSPAATEQSQGDAGAAKVAPATPAKPAKAKKPAGSPTSRAKRKPAQGKRKATGT